MMHPTGLHGYIPRWKGDGAADNSKDSGNDTIKTNFAEMDVSKHQQTWYQKPSVCVLSQLKSPMQRPRGNVQHL